MNDLVDLQVGQEAGEIVLVDVGCADQAAGIVGEAEFQHSGENDLTGGDGDGDWIVVGVKG